jgi:Zn finger protein HypA/HybF involved in hydrogenase expression
MPSRIPAEIKCQTCNGMRNLQQQIRCNLCNGAGLIYK